MVATLETPRPCQDCGAIAPPATMSDGTRIPICWDCKRLQDKMARARALMMAQAWTMSELATCGKGGEG